MCTISHTIHLLSLSLAKSLKVVDIITLAAHRASLRPIVEFICLSIVESVPKTRGQQLSVTSSWLLRIVKQSAISLNVLCNFITNKLLGTSPTLKQKWRALRVTAMILQEDCRKNTDISAVHNLLINLISTINPDEEDMEVEGRKLTTEKIRKKAEKLLLLNYRK